MRKSLENFPQQEDREEIREHEIDSDGFENRDDREIENARKRLENERMSRDQLLKRDSLDMRNIRKRLEEGDLSVEEKLRFLESRMNLRAEEPEKGTFGMFRELWGVVPAEYRMTLIGEFMFNPRAIQNRYREEQKFRSNLDRRWKK